MVRPCIWLGTTHPCNPPQYCLWVNLHFFTICMYKHCFLSVLLVFVMKCIKVSCSLPHNHYCCSLPSPAYLPHLLICTCLSSAPIACPLSSVLCWCLRPLLAHLHLCYVDVYCVFFYSLVSVLKFHSFVLNCVCFVTPWYFEFNCKCVKKALLHQMCRALQSTRPRPPP